jgi:enolase
MHLNNSKKKRSCVLVIFSVVANARDLPLHTYIHVVAHTTMPSPQCNVGIIFQYMHACM